MSGSSSDTFERDLSLAALGRAQRKLDTLNRRAKKLGFGPASIETLEPLYVKKDFEGRRYLVVAAKLRDDDARRVGGYRVRISGPEFRIEGHEFLATADFSYGEPVANLSPAGQEAEDAEDLGRRCREATGRCDHCGTRRVRKVTYLLRTPEGGLKWVGKSCMKDFMGHSPASIAWLHELSRAGSEEDDFDPSSAAQSDAIGLGFLAWAALSVRLGGWISKSRARSYNEALEPQVQRAETAGDHDEVARLLRQKLTPTADDALGRASLYRFHGTGPAPTDEDRALVDEALEWAMALEPRSDYEHKVHVIARAGWCRFKDWGVAASVVGVYRQRQEQEAQREAKAAAEAAKPYTSEPLASEKERVTFEAQVEMVRELPGNAYGPSWLVKLRTPQGHLVTWFASRAPEFETGSTIRAKATIKGTKEFRGRTETQVNRLAVL